jgi:hypothetical protein
MAGEDANVEIALARSLVERMDEGDARRMWGKVVNACPATGDETPLPEGEQDSPESDLQFWLDTVAPPASMSRFRQRRRHRVLATCHAASPKRDGASRQQWLF